MVATDGVVFWDAKQVMRSSFTELGARFFDGNGKTRMWLTEQGLSFHDEAAKVRASIGLCYSEPRLSLIDAAARSRIVLGSTEVENGRTGAVTSYPISTITVLDENGQVSWQAP